MRHFTVFIKKLTALTVSSAVFAALPCVCAEKVSVFATNAPEQVEVHIGEFTVTEGYMSTPFSVTPSPSNQPRSTFSLRTSVLPSSYDMRDYGYVTSPKSQGSLGACWTFSGLSNLESYILRHLDINANPDFSENHLRFSMSRYASDGNWFWGDDRYPGDGGNFLRTTSYLSRGGGPIADSADPYEDDSTIRRTVEQLKLENGIKENLPIDIGENNYLSGSNGLYTLTDTTMLAMTDDRETNIEKIKRTIYGQNAVDLGIYWNTSYYVNGTAIYCDVPIFSANHEINLVGWDDGYSKSNFKQTQSRTFVITDSSGNQTEQTYGGTTPEGDGAFLVKNSWGTDSGEDGYYWISYYDMIFSRSDAEANCISGVSTETYDNIYQYDPLLPNGWITPNESQTSRFAAIYPAKYGETVGAAGFYTFDENCDYKIRVMTDETSFDDVPVVAEGHLPNAGFHAIEFDDVYVKGINFAVIVDITCLDEGVYPRIAVEVPTETINTNATANASETYISISSDLLIYDTSKVISGGENISACLKAYTNNPEPGIGLSGYAGYDTSANTATFSLANNTGTNQNAICIIAVYKDGRLENAFLQESLNIAAGASADVSYSYSSPDCTIKSMIFYKDSTRPVMPKPSFIPTSYAPSSPAFFEEKIFINPGDKKCINIMDENSDVTDMYTFTSSDDSVASVSGGIITAGSSPGYAKITATCGTTTITAEVFILY